MSKMTPMLQRMKQKTGASARLAVAAERDVKLQLRDVTKWVTDKLSAWVGQKQQQLVQAASLAARRSDSLFTSIVNRSNC